MRKLLLFILSCVAMHAGAQTIFQENFNTSFPAGWSIINGGTTADTWYRTTALFNGNSLDGTQFMFVNSDAAGNSPSIILSERLESPAVNTNLYSSVFLEFDQYYRDYSQDSGFVEVFNGSTWVKVASYSNNMGGWGAPDHQIINLTPYRNAAMKVRFRYEDNAIWAWYWAVDNIHLYAPQPWDGEMVAILAPQTGCGLGNNAQVSVAITNTGTDTLFNYTLSYRVNGGGIVNQAGTVPVPPQDTLIRTFAAGANLSQGGRYSFQAWISAPGDANTTNDTVSGYIVKNYQAAAFPYFEDFEGGQAGWFSEGTNSTWAFGTPAKDVIIGAASGTKAWVTGGLGTTNHSDNDNSWVNGRCMDLTGISLPEIALDIWFNSEFSWDGAALQASVDFGNSWATIGVNGEPDNWYTDDAIDGNPGGQAMGWTGRNATGNGSGGWVTARHKVYAFSGQQNVIFRIAFGSDGSVTDDGFGFDNFRIAETPFVELGNDTIVCDSIQLNAGAAASYVWSTGETTPTIIADTSGLYEVSVTDANGFTGTDLIHITVVKTDQINLGNDTLLCPGETLFLYAGAPATSYNWSTGSTNASLFAATTGNYAVTVTYAGGCQGTDDINVTVSALNAAFSPGNDTVCRGIPVIFQNASAGGGTSWWDFGDGNFSANINPTHIFFSGGSYPVTLTVTDGSCEHSITQWIYADICTSVDNPQLSGVNIWPNPTQDKVWIEVLHGNSPDRIRVFNAAGQICREMEWNSTGRQEIDLSELPAGIYHLQLIDADQANAIRIIKQ